VKRSNAHFDTTSAVLRTPPPKGFFARLGDLIHAVAMVIVGLLFYAVVVGMVFLVLLFAIEFAASGTFSTRMLRAFADFIPRF
jgi:hypothetical protein